MVYPSTTSPLGTETPPVTGSTVTPTITPAGQAGIAGTASSTSPTAISGKSSAAIEEAREGARRFVDRVADKSASAVYSLGAKGEQLMTIERRYANATRQYIRENPLTSVAVAACAGLLLSQLWRRQSR